MNLIATLERPGESTDLRDTYRVRHAARAVVTDAVGATALLYSNTRDYYKLPGGGIEPSEDVESALRREVKEEIGCEIDITGEIGEIIEWRDAIQQQQISQAYHAVVRGEKGDAALEDNELVDGFETVWVATPAEALALVKRAVGSDDIFVDFMARRDAAFLSAAMAAQT